MTNNVRIICSPPTMATGAFAGEQIDLAPPRFALLNSDSMKGPSNWSLTLARSGRSPEK
jgi:hypothetical protein